MTKQEKRRLEQAACRPRRGELPVKGTRPRRLTFGLIYGIKIVV